jgi:hypothetical protein
MASVASTGPPSVTLVSGFDDGEGAMVESDWAAGADVVASSAIMWDGVVMTFRASRGQVRRRVGEAGK